MLEKQITKEIKKFVPEMYRRGFLLDEIIYTTTGVSYRFTPKENHKSLVDALKVTHRILDMKEEVPIENLRNFKDEVLKYCEVYSIHSVKCPKNPKIPIATVQEAGYCNDCSLS